MSLDHATSLAAAQRYFKTHTVLRRLGWGISGFVYLSPDSRTAVKVHRHNEPFERELDVYRRLRRLRITRLHGLTVPRLRGYSNQLKLIRMDFVAPPFLLDFAGVHLDPPDFEAETMQQWHERIVEYFGPNSHIIYDIYNSLAQHGLYYLDFRPSNVNLTGLPGLQPHDPSASDQ